MFRTVKNALKLPFAGAVANNSKQSFRGIIKQPSYDGLFYYKILFSRFRLFAVHCCHQFVQRRYMILVQ